MAMGEVLGTYYPKEKCIALISTIDSAKGLDRWKLAKLSITN